MWLLYYLESLNAAVPDIQLFDQSCQTIILELIYDNNKDSVIQNIKPVHGENPQTN